MGLKVRFPFCTFKNRETCETDNLIGANNTELRTELPRHQHSHIESFKYYSVDNLNEAFQRNALDLSTISVNVLEAFTVIMTN